MPTKKKTNRKKSNKRNAKKSSVIKKLVISVIAIILVAVTVLVSLMVSHTGRKLPNPLLGSSKDVAFGVDVSHHNGKINWDELKDEVDFAIIRVGYRGYANAQVCLDKNVKRNLKAANEAGVPVGVYFYTQAVNEDEAIAEAEFTLNVIKKYDISLPVFFDIEYPTEKGKHIGRLYKADLSRAENVAIINAFCKTVEDAGYQSGVYASSFMYRDRFKMSKLNRSAYIWVADYNDRVTYNGDYDLWQFSSKGKVKGVPKKVDKNYWYIKK